MELTFINVPQAGRQEAKNVQKILNNEHPDQKVNAEHRDYQKAHKDLGMHHALEFKEAVKVSCLHEESESFRDLLCRMPMVLKSP